MYPEGNRLTALSGCRFLVFREIVVFNSAIAPALPHAFAACFLASSRSLRVVVFSFSIYRIGS